MGRKNKKVKNPKSAKRNLKSDVIPVTNVEKVTFDFSYKNWLQSITIKGKDFTNKLYNEKQYSEMITTLFSKLVPYIQEHWKDIKSNNGKNYQYRHCHIIKDEPKNLVLEIAESIHKNPILDEEDDFKIWQFGTVQGVRLITIFDHNNEVLYPIFVDYHHQIYPSQSYNQKDLMNYTYSPMDCIK